MAICRICGAEFKVGTNTAYGICNNAGCWRKAWNNTVAPFRKEKPNEVQARQNRRITPYEKEQIIQLFRSGKTRKQIADTEGIRASYETICNIIRSYGKRGE